MSTTTTPPKKKAAGKSKFGRATLLKVGLLLGVLIIAAFLVKDAAHTPLAKRYSVSWPTTQKFALMRTWLIEGPDFTAVADLTRLASVPALNHFLNEVLFKGDDAAHKTVRTLLEDQTKIGMLAVSLNIGGSGVPPFFTVVAQGDFRKMNLLKAISSELAAEGVYLTSKSTRGIKIYWQKGSPEPFAFALPDDNHLLVGTKESLEHIFKSPEDEVPLSFEPVDSPFFGTLTFSGHLRKVFPEQIASPEKARFMADDHGRLHVHIQCPNAEQATNLKLFLAGMKALYVLQAEDDERLLAALDQITIEITGVGVRVDVPLDRLPTILSGQ